MGCRVVLSTDAAMLISLFWSTSSPLITRTTRGVPLVRVPVLSSTTVSMPAASSSTSPPLSSSPRWAPMEVPTSTAVGVASPSAHGHATTITSMASFRLISSTAWSASPAACSRASGNHSHPRVDQKASVAADMPITVPAKGPTTLSAKRCTGACRAWASSTRRLMSASWPVAPSAVASTNSGASQFTVPPVTRLPLAFSTGMDSPVSMHSSTLDLPRTTLPSTGSFSPGSTCTTSPTRSTLVGTSVVCSVVAAASGSALDSASRTSLALSGTREASACRSDCARSLAWRSRLRPRSTNARSITGSSAQPASQFSSGTAAASAAKPKDAVMPRATSEFILGFPFLRATKPSEMSLRPGPTMASAAIAVPTHGCPTKVISSPCAYSCIPMWCKWCPRCDPMDSSASAHAPYSSNRASCISRWCVSAAAAADLAASAASVGLTVVGKPLSVTIATHDSMATAASASPSNHTAAELVTRFTLALDTSGRASSMRCTAPEHPAQRMLATSRSTTCPAKD
mmetsp:Transcript_47718/g.91185  ORF Transcript_47718/g.91185 Transcript_47718/m.91185 type:complete len:515 (-) Transcript_47718:411-1955(-)